MDEKEFRRLLSEVAEWRIPETITDTVSGEKRKRKSKDVCEELCDPLVEEEVVEEINEQNSVNDTFPPQLIRIKCLSQCCEDCGKVCENGRIKQKRIYEANSKRHWRDYCKSCEMFKDPYTDQYTLPKSKAARTWNDYVRNQNKKKKRQQEKVQIDTVTVSQGNPYIKENDKEIIRIYSGQRIVE